MLKTPRRFRERRPLQLLIVDDEMQRELISLAAEHGGTAPLVTAAVAG